MVKASAAVGLVLPTLASALSCSKLQVPGTILCKDYLGPEWNSTVAGKDCAGGLVPGLPGGVLDAGACSLASSPGVCVADKGTVKESRLVFYGAESTPGQNARSCGSFLGGAFYATVPAGSCSFSGPAGPGVVLAQCVSYTGAGWTAASAGSDCAKRGSGAAFSPGGMCPPTSVGWCTVNNGTASEADTFYQSGSADALKAGCTTFAKGTWHVPGAAAAPPSDSGLEDGALEGMASDAGATVEPEGCDSACVQALAVAKKPVLFFPTVESKLAPAAGAGTCQFSAKAGPVGPALKQCVSYTGAGWTAASAGADCAKKSGGAFVAGPAVACPTTTVGWCVLGAGSGSETAQEYLEGSASSLKSGCETFAKGQWVSAAAAAASNPAIKRGLVLLPGGAVDCRAYAPLAKLVAARGTALVALFCYESKLPILEPLRALPFVKSRPDLKWAAAGHSLGGVTAAILVANNTALFKAYGSLAGGVAADQPLNATTDLRAVFFSAFVGAAYDPEPAGYRASLLAMPKAPATERVEIPGGVHAGYGYYVPDPEDPLPTLPRATQQQVVADGLVHLLRRMDQPAATKLDDVWTSGQPFNADACRKFQVAISGFTASQFPSKFSQVVYAEEGPFKSSKVNYSDANGLVLRQHEAFRGNAEQLSAPSGLVRELWCKMFTQEALTSKVKMSGAPAKQQGSCKQLNQAVHEAALERVGFWAKLKYQSTGAKVVFKDDIDTSSGGEWVAAPVTVLTNGKVTEVTAARLITPLTVPEPFSGAYYCKLWSEQGALLQIRNALEAGWFSTGLNQETRTPQEQDAAASPAIVAGLAVAAAAGVLGAALVVRRRRAAAAGRATSKAMVASVDGIEQQL
jgi:hypothetical protein